jgi:hypothetical protein
MLQVKWLDSGIKASTADKHHPLIPSTYCAKATDQIVSREPCGLHHMEKTALFVLIRLFSFYGGRYLRPCSEAEHGKAARLWYMYSIAYRPPSALRFQYALLDFIIA